MHLWAQIEIHATFLAFVALAVYAQALTGFALALILLGLVGATNLVPLTDAVNASTLTGFCTAAMFHYRQRIAGDLGLPGNIAGARHHQPVALRESVPAGWKHAALFEFGNPPDGVIVTDAILVRIDREDVAGHRWFVESDVKPLILQTHH